jgi:prophage tail gpP-like protein
MSDPVVIKIGNEYWDKPSDMRIDLSVENIAGVFSLAFPQFIGNAIFKKINKMGAAAQILIGDVPVINGFIESIRVVNQMGNRRVTMSGRDKTGDLVDCSFVGTPNEWKKQTVLNIIKDLCAPFGIAVVASGSAASAASAIIETYKATEGVAIFSLISQLCVDNSVMPISIGDGKLTLVRAEDAQQISDKIENPGNVIAAEFVADDMDRFSAYTVRGQGIETPEKSLDAFLQVSGAFADAIVSRTRTKMMFPENPATNEKCIARAKWEAKYRAGMSRQFEYTVGNFLRANGKPWSINSLISVSDDNLKYDNSLYCHGVSFQRNGAHDRTMLSLAPAYTFTADGKIEKTVVDT